MGEEPAAAAAAATVAPAHVVLVSFPAQGHINPLLRLAKRLAAKGLLVTFTSTHDIGKRIQASSAAKPTASPAGPAPTGGPGRLRFEFFSDGWDADHDPRRHDLDALTAQLATAGKDNFKALVRRQADEGRPVACVVNNPFLPWALDAAEELGVPSAVLWVQSCAVFSTYHHYFHSPADFPADVGSDVALRLPGLPALGAGDIPSFLLHSSPYRGLKDVILSQFRNIGKAEWVFANSFEELERDAIDALAALGSPVVPVGPLVEVGGGGGAAAAADLWRAEEECMGWLDAQAPRSVVYVSVGSVAVLSREEMEEMAHGLAGCGRPFLWVVREDCRGLLPEGFAEEGGAAGGGRGRVVAWSPQERVLAHGAVACFVTHCGWNSTLEALAAGVPVVAYPQFGDQLTDAKFLVDVYGVGVRLGAPVGREELVRRVAEVTAGEGAEGIRRRCAELKEAAARAVAEGGSSDRNVQAFVDEIRRRACGGGGRAVVVEEE